ncbi:MAG: hypothetical protein AAGG75_06165 [Bacteroidota bacterium]
MLTQIEIQELILPLLKEKGQLYRKFKKVFARRAVDGERIDTITDDGLETTNTAESGDYIVTNQTGAEESYILTPKKFEARYEWLQSDASGRHLYQPKGQVMVLEMTTEQLHTLQLDNPFYFIAPWGSEMIVKTDDFLVSPPDYSEVYRIARKEFFETYQKA